ncbi:hypothetical protein OQA88_12963 [Cercophora sp. LCS_1]
MPSAAPATPIDDARYKAVLENQNIKFHIKTGGAKWVCTVTDRATHERVKAGRTGSSSSVSSAGSESSVESK